MLRSSEDHQKSGLMIAGRRLPKNVSMFSTSTAKKDLEQSVCCVKEDNRKELDVRRTSGLCLCDLGVTMVVVLVLVEQLLIPTRVVPRRTHRQQSEDIYRDNDD